MATLGEQIRRERQRRKLTIADLAPLAQVSQRQLGRIERGETSGGAAMTRLLAALELLPEPTTAPPAIEAGDDPRLSEASFVQVWLRLFQLWEARTGGAESMVVHSDEPPPIGLLREGFVIKIEPDDRHRHHS